MSDIIFNELEFPHDLILGGFVIGVSDSSDEIYYQDLQLDESLNLGRMHIFTGVVEQNFKKTLAKEFASYKMKPESISYYPIRFGSDAVLVFWLDVDPKEFDKAIRRKIKSLRKRVIDRRSHKALPVLMHLSKKLSVLNIIFLLWSVLINDISNLFIPDKWKC